MYRYDERVQAPFRFNPAMVNQRPTDPGLSQYDLLLDYGSDHEGYYVVRKNTWTGRVVRIDFYPPGW